MLAHSYTAKVICSWKSFTARHGGAGLKAQQLRGWGRNVAGHLLHGKTLSQNTTSKRECSWTRMGLGSLMLFKFGCSDKHDWTALSLSSSVVLMQGKAYSQNCLCFPSPPPTPTPVLLMPSLWLRTELLGFQSWGTHSGSQRPSPSSLFLFLRFLLLSPFKGLAPSSFSHLGIAESPRQGDKAHASSPHFHGPHTV